MIKIAKQRILESKLSIGEKSRLLEKYQTFEGELRELFYIEITEVKIALEPKKKK